MKRVKKMLYIIGAVVLCVGIGKALDVHPAMGIIAVCAMFVWALFAVTKEEKNR